MDPASGILFNRLGCRTQEDLDRAEADVVQICMAALGRTPLSGRFDSLHLKAIHKFLFAPIDDWAGEFRTVGISRDNSMFCAPAHIDSYAAGIFKDLARERFLKAELKRRHLSYRDLTEKLAAIGIQDSERNITNKVNRGTFAAAFFVQCLEAIGCHVLHIRLDDA